MKLYIVVIVHMNNDPCKTLKNICFLDKEIEKQTKIATHMDYENMVKFE